MLKQIIEMKKATTPLKELERQMLIYWVIYGVIAILILNISISSTVYRFKHKKATETEIFLHIPKSFIWNNN